LRKPLQRIGPAIGWASLILIATSIRVPVLLASASPTGADKLVHVMFYSDLGADVVGGCVGVLAIQAAPRRRESLS